MYEHLTTAAEIRQWIFVPEQVYIKQYLHTGFANIQSVLKIGLLGQQHVERLFQTTAVSEITASEGCVSGHCVWPTFFYICFQGGCLLIWMITPCLLRKLVSKGQVT
jgi:hypothetical protein